MTTFGPDDRDDSARDVLVQPDGKILLAGDSGSSETRMAVTRLNRDGTLDTAFGDGGMAAPDFEGQDSAAGAALQPDGKILIAGTTHPGAHFAVARIGRVTLTRAAFAVARRGTAVAAARGTSIRYSLSEPATVTLRFQRATAGRRVGRACRPLTARTRHRRPCRRYVAAGTLRRTGLAGPNRVPFSGRIGRRALRRGIHRLLLTATDPAGNRATSRPRGFRIVRRNRNAPPA